MKNKAFGFYSSLITAVLAAAGLVFYLINCKTAYFANLGINPAVLGCAGVAVIALVLNIALSGSSEKLPADVCSVAAPVLLALALVYFASSRVNGIASIMTFENNAQTMRDLPSAIIGIALMAVAMIVAMVSAFFDVRKG